MTNSLEIPARAGYITVMTRSTAWIAMVLLGLVGMVGNPPVLSAQQAPMALEVAPAAVVPLAGSTDTFELGVGGTLRAGYPLGSGGQLFISGALGYTAVPTRADTRLSLVSLGAGPAVRIPFSESIGLDVLSAAGAYLGIYEDVSAANPFASVGTQLSVSFSNAFSMGLGATYDYYLTNSNGTNQPLFTGLSAFVGGRVVPGASGSRRPRIEIQPPQFERVFPVFFSYYDENSLGSVTVRNGESGPIEDVRVSMVVDQYMNSPKVSPTIERMGRGEAAEVDLFALFRRSILDVTEPTSVQATIRVEYEYRGEQLAREEAFALRVQNRNQITWDDDRKVASFVTAGDPTVLRFSRNTTAAIRAQGTTAVNEQFRLAMGIFEAIRLHGIEYVIDPDSSYIELSRDENALDYVQFPQQTLDFRAGDCDDLSILYSSLLESVGIETAFITTPGHLLMAFALDMDEDEARRTFNAQRDLIFRDGRVWVPVETTLVQEGFIRAWAAGGKQWREATSQNLAGFHSVRQAWQTYEPTGFASVALDIAIPASAALVPDYTAALNQFIEREISSQVERLRERIAASGNSPRLVNRLGILYARYGLYEEALNELSPLVRGNRPHVPSLVNIGNIYYLSDDLEAALDYYDRAFRLRRDDPGILISLARAHFEREEYAAAEERYRMAEVLAPELARDFSYIVSETSGTETGRASSTQQTRVVWDEE